MAAFSGSPPYRLFPDDDVAEEAIRADELNYAQLALTFKTESPISTAAVYSIRTAYNFTPTHPFTGCSMLLTIYIRELY